MTNPMPTSMPTHPLCQCSPEVAEALRHGQPVVALESTIIAHGMPYPDNLDTAKAVEALIRQEGAVPATIALMDGLFRVGLTEAELLTLATSPDVAKLSRRDMALALTRGRLGATTVASTMIVAALAGIRVFVTGGIGGVHRGGATSMDISADLQELARTPVAVVCAGAKSVLDLTLTLEYLETHGVPVVGVGSQCFAAFYTQDSGLMCDARIDEPAAQAEFLRAHWGLGLGSGVVFSNPIPGDAAMPKSLIEGITQQALTEAQQQGVHGKEVTPFLLARIKALTGGKSLDANKALVKNNAVVGARLAVALSASAQG